MLESVLLLLGTSTARAVARTWLKSDLAIDISDGLIDRLGSRVPSLRDRRRTARQFEDMADRVAQQLTPVLENEFGGIAENELTAAVLAVRDVVDSFQGIQASTLFEQDLEPVSLEELLMAQPSSRVRDELDPAAQMVFDRLLRENCNYIVELTMSMPQFTSSAIVEVLRRETEIMDRVREALDRIPKPALAAADADAAFTLRYRRHISRELDRLELFGITLAERSSRYELSIAYITLAASTDQPDETVDGKDSELSPESDAAEDSEEQEAYLRVDQALARGQRHLIRGEAGSGKTTLLQWLAVTAARRGFVGDLESWVDDIPFFLQLRRYSNKNLPSPEEFLENTAKMIAGVMPPGWVHRQLESGKAILLVDGVDELPEHQRPKAREWLLRLLHEFPDCRFVITTRPPAVPENWLTEGAFSLSELLPMSLPDIVSFVQHWYDAARRFVVHDEEESSRLTHYQQELIRVIRDTPTIRALATTPLLCAMLCALNRDRRTQLPRDRMELYRIALESLLDRRDVEREITQQDELSLGLREKEILLQDLAYWLIQNEQTDVSKVAALSRIRDRLEFMTTIAADAEQIFDHLLARSGLIREPVEGRIDFIHRTFQEYLAAARAVREGDIPMLIRNADDDQWREVLILAAGHGNTAQRDELILGLLARGTAEEWHRHRLHLLAVACLETAVELSPETAEAVHKSLTEALPPTNMTEARAVASAGPLAAPLLAEYAHTRATTAAACVRALCLIGGEAALSALGRFRDDDRVTVIRELIRGWDYFDRETYVDEILAGSRLDYGTISVTDVDALSTVDRLGRMSRLHFATDRSVTELADLPNLELVSSLDVSASPSLATLDGIARCVRLLSLRVAHNRRIEKLPALPAALERLVVDSCSALRDLSTLGQLPALQRLMLTQLPATEIPSLDGPINNLTLQGMLALESLDWLRDLSELQQLRITNAWYDRNSPAQLWWGRQKDLSVLAQSTQLKRFYIWPAFAFERMDGLGSNLVSVEVFGASELVDAEALTLSTGIERLMLDGALSLRDFDFLRRLPNLQSLDLERTSNFDDLSLLSSEKTLGRLILSGTSVSDLSPLSAYTSLHSLQIEGCPVRSLEPLKDLPRRMTLYIDPELAGLVSPALRARHAIRVTASS